MKRRRGFILVDVMIGLTVVTVLAILLAEAAGQQNRAEQRLATLRSADRLAETILSDLQTGATLPPQGAAQFQIVPLATGQAAGDFRWCSVHVILKGQSASIVGLVPAKAVPQ